MKTWKKIGIGLLILLAGTVVYLYIAGSNTSTPDEQDTASQENPIFPFEDSGDNFFGGDSPNEDEVDTPSDQTQEDPPRLWQISERPVAGSQWVAQSTSSNSIWYVRKENGHLYESDPIERQLTRLTNTTIPRVREALISPEGDYIVYRYLEEGTGIIKTYLANLSESEANETPYEINGRFLPDNLTSVNLSPDGSELFYLQANSNEASGVVHNLSDNTDHLVFQSQVKGWRSQWTTADEITLFSKPAINSTGVVYKINTNTGELRKLAEGDGLVATLDPSNEYILTSSSEEGQYKSRLKSVSDQDTTLMSLQTMADKCSWGQQGVSILVCGVPDDISTNPIKEWYQGRVSFDDTLATFNPNSRDYTTLFTPDDSSKGPFDIINIKSDSKFNNLMFTNKKTGILWGYEL